MKLWASIRVAVLFLVLHQVSGQATYTFDCRRNLCQGTTGSSCDISAASPVCTCGNDPGGAALTGYSCEGSGTDCSTLTTCGLGACKTVNSVDICECNMGYYFDVTTGTCLERTSVVSCSSTNMQMQIVPYKDFPANAKIYISGHDGTAACLFSPSTDANGVVKYTLTQTFASTTCGAVTTVGALYSYVVIVQYGAAVTYLDQAVTFTCNVLASGDSATSSTPAIAIDTAGTPGAGLQATTSQTDSSSGLTVTLGRLDGVVIGTTPQTLGTPMVLTIELDTTNEFAFMKVKTVTAKDDSGSNTIEMVKDGCAQIGALTVLTSFASATPTNKYVVTVGFKLFKFPGSASLTFDTDIVLCAGTGDAPCAASGCADTTLDIQVTPGTGSIALGIGRRKRQAEQPVETLEKKMAVTLLVADPPFLSHQPIPTDDQSCLKNMVFLLPLVLLTVLLLVSVCMSLFFCLKVTRTRSHEGMTNMAYKS